ncbi:MAG: quinone-dependent dihydroorotate dehydrogenase [Pseudomonadota bacterium]
MSVADVLIDRLALDRAGAMMLRALPPERAHDLALALLRRIPAPNPAATPSLGRTVAGLHFANGVGIAAGFDKNAVTYGALLRWGFGFVEVGTVTPRPQAGNPKPRVFRLPAEAAVINRLGFNNEGHIVVARRLEGRDRRLGVVGVNIGCNKDAADPVADYVAGIRAFADLADYLTINVSSPNTPGLRAMQHGSELTRLLDAILAERSKRGPGSAPLPLFVKLAPDLAPDELDVIVATVNDRPVDGLVLTNTLLARPTDLRGRHAREAGGLSGRPVRERATEILRLARAALAPDRAIISVGGIDGPASAGERLAAGADLLQLYTGLVYGGLGLGRRIVRGLASERRLA